MTALGNDDRAAHHLTLTVLAAPLATAKVPIFLIATFDTDYILVHQGALERAIGALEGAGHRVLVEVVGGSRGAAGAQGAVLRDGEAADC